MSAINTVHVLGVMDNVNEARAAQDIRDSAAFVVRQLTAKYPEVHLKRALAIELQARGFLAHAEAQIPTWYRASDGRVLHRVRGGEGGKRNRPKQPSKAKDVEY